MINSPANDEIVKKVGGDPYAAAVLVSKRAKEIEQTKRSYLENANIDKPVTVACEEVYQDKVKINNYKNK